MTGIPLTRAVTILVRPVTVLCVIHSIASIEP